MRAFRVWVLFALAATGFAQRQIPSQVAAPGSTQDFSKAGVSRPMRVGTTLPSTCKVGDEFFKSDATAGQNLYGCTATNTWTQQAGSGTIDAGSILSAQYVSTAGTSTVYTGCPATAPTIAANQQFFVHFHTTNGANPTLNLCASGAKTIVNFNGNTAVAATQLSTAVDYLVYNDGTYIRLLGLFMPTAGATGTITVNADGTIDVTDGYFVSLAGSSTITGTINNTGAAKSLPHRTGTGSPNARDNCSTVGETFYQSDATAGSNTWGCTGTGTPGTWTLQGGSSGPTYSSGVGWIAPVGVSDAAGSDILGGDGPASRFTLVQFTVHDTFPLKSVAFNVGTAPGAGKGVVVGIYNTACSTLLGQKTLVNPSGSSLWTFSSTVNLTPGSYLFAIGLEASTSLNSFVGGANGLMLQLLAATTPRVAIASSTTGTGASLALPASCTPGAIATYYRVPTPVLLPE